MPLSSGVDLLGLLCWREYRFTLYQAGSLSHRTFDIACRCPLPRVISSWDISSSWVISSSWDISSQSAHGNACWLSQGLSWIPPPPSLGSFTPPSNTSSLPHRFAADDRPINGQPIYWNVDAPPRYDPARSVVARVSRPHIFRNETLECPSPLSLSVSLSFSLSFSLSSLYLLSIFLSIFLSVSIFLPLLPSLTRQIPLQLASGTQYTVFAQDDDGYFTGINPVEIQTVGLGSDSSCLTDVVTHTHDFTFAVSGRTDQCDNKLELSWQDNLGIGPYNFTILPLDTSTNPFDVRLRGGGTTTGETGWVMNMTAGTRFTIMMK